MFKKYYDCKKKIFYWDFMTKEVLIVIEPHKQSEYKELIVTEEKFLD
jgi:hypothetical protein